MGALLAWLGNFLAGESGRAVGRTISWAALLSAAVPIAVSAIGHKDEIAVSLTWGQLALFAGFAWALIETAARARAPGP